jgi:hypothetical protein
MIAVRLKNGTSYDGTAARNNSVLNASRAIDTKYGTQITQDVWKNVMPGNFTPYP